MQHKISKHTGAIYKLDDIEIGFDPRPLTKRNKK